MAKVAVVGQNVSNMIDCSEAVPMPIPPVNKNTTFPAGTGPGLLELTCKENVPFPSLATDRESCFLNVLWDIRVNELLLFLAGFPTTILPCPQGDCPAMG